MRSTAVRFLCRVLIAFVALYAANDGLLQAYAHDGSDGIVRSLPARSAMPVLAAAGSEDERDLLPTPDGPGLGPPSIAAPLLREPVRLARVVDARPLPPSPPSGRPGARAPPFPLHATA